jgi:amino acid transporter/mannitol/fructose-specific phosphotransferase system IIA component (Ntr-type)
MTSDGGRKLAKELTLLDVYVIALGPMLSSGFFLLPGLAAAKTGPSVVLAYFLAGLLVLPAMLSKAELATAMPRAGGTYYFLDRSLGPLVGTVGGLGTWLVLILKSAFALIGMGAYLGLIAGYPMKSVAIGLTAVFVLVNLVGAKESSGLQRFLVITVLVFLAVFTVQGLMNLTGGESLPTMRETRFSPFFTHGAQGLFATIGLVFISYAGLTKVASISEEVRDPDRNLPLGMLLALLTASAVYVVGIFLVVSVVDPDVLHGDLTPIATAGLSFFDWIPRPVALGLVVVPALAGLAAAGNAGILAASRYPLAMARDNLISPRFARLGRFKTPSLALLATGALMVFAISTLDVLSVAKLASTFQLLIFALVNLAVIVMRESGIEAYDPGFRSPGYPWVQVVGLLAPALLIAVMGLMPIVFAIGLVGVCLVWYFHYGRDRVVRGGALLHWFERLGQRRFEGLDPELRGILKEKGVRAEDAFDEVVARAYTLDLKEDDSFEEATRRAANRLAQRLPVGAEHLVEGFLHGTRTGATPVSHGTALPHLRIQGVAAPEMVLARSVSGLTVDVGDQFTDEQHGERIHAVFFLVSPEENPGQHLRLLAGVAGRADDDDFMDAWLAAEEPGDFREAVLRDERFLSLHIAVRAPTGSLVGVAVKDVPWPEGTLLALVRREGAILIPSGDTALRAGDRLSIVGHAEGIRAVRARYLTVADVEIPDFISEELDGQEPASDPE